jgi:hypothetical protein
MRADASEAMSNRQSALGCDRSWPLYVLLQGMSVVTDVTSPAALSKELGKPALHIPRQSVKS